MQARKSITINSSTTVEPDGPLLLLSGPCQIESYDHCCMIGNAILESTKNLPITYVFKSSFDKANRTSVTGARGPGLEAGLEILERVKNTLGIPVVTDIHTAEQAATVAEVADILQIPAFLCRQTDLLTAAGNTGKSIHVKKGQFLHPSDMLFCIEKIAATGNENILLCERGTCFGYRDLIVDMRSLAIMADTGFPVVFDATHSVQSMGGAGGSSGGSREYIPILARAAIATGCTRGVFIECHDNPDSAPSDGKSMLPLEAMPDLLQQLTDLYSCSY